MPLNSIKKFGIKFSDLWGRGSESDEEAKKDRETRPPDLDKLWHNFNMRLNSLFKRKKGGSDGGKGGEPSSNNEYQGLGLAMTILGLVIAAYWMISGTFLVPEGHAGIVMTFGQHTDTKQPGYTWRWPYPFQSHEVVNVSSARKVEVGFRSAEKSRQAKEALMLTSDDNIVDIQFAVQYRVKSASDWAFSNSGEQEDIVRQLAESAMREVVGKNKMDFVLNEGRDKIAQDAIRLMQTAFDNYVSGVQVTNVTMQAVQPPDKAQAAFEDVTKAGSERERLKNDGKAYANEVLPKARAAAARLTQDAEGYRSRVVVNAEGDTERFKLILAEYQKSPVVTRDRMYIETMQQIYTSTSKVMVDTKNGSTVYLPLDKIMAQTASHDVPAAKPVAQAAVESAAPSPAASASVIAQPVAAQPAPAAKGIPSTRARESRDREAR